MLEARVLWLQPGSHHPVFQRYAELFGGLFTRLEIFDYRAVYLDAGGRELESRLWLAIKAMAPHVVLYTQFPNSYAYLRPECLARIREIFPVVGIGWDDEIYFDQAKYFYESCSAVITTDVDSAKWLNQAGTPAHVVVTAWLTHPVPIGLSEDIPVSFVGDMTKPGRREFIQQLEAAGIPVLDFGFGSRNGFLSPEDVIRVFVRSKVNLNFTVTNPPAWVLRHGPLRAGKRQIKGRPFELASLGRFCLSEWAPCINLWFTPGLDIDIFRDAPDLIHQVRRYLEDGERRLEMGMAAQKKFLHELSPEIQFGRVFSDILMTFHKETWDQNELLPKTPIFHESMGRSRGAAFLYALCRGALLRAIQEIFLKWSWHLAYWRGFLGVGLESVMKKIRGI